MKWLVGRSCSAVLGCVILLSTDLTARAAETTILPVRLRIVDATVAAEKLAGSLDFRVLAPAGKPLDSFRCAEPPSGPKDLMMDGFYADRGAGSSVVDPVRMERYRQANEALSLFGRGFGKMTDAYLRPGAFRPEIAACALAWLDAWTQAGSLTGNVSQQGGFVRKWMLAELASNYLKIRLDSGLDPEMRLRVETWLSYLGGVVKEDYSTGMDRGSRRNNHSYWAAWAVMATGVAVNNRTYFDWSITRFKAGVALIDADGALPLEIARSSKALHYHLFSLGPLVLMAETAAVNGIDLYGTPDDPLARLVIRTLSGLDDPVWFRARAGAEQSWVGKLTGEKLAWLPVWSSRFSHPLSTRWGKAFDRYLARRLGGDLGAVFAAGQ